MQPAPVRNRAVLVVESDPATRRALDSSLRALGYNPTAPSLGVTPNAQASPTYNPSGATPPATGPSVGSPGSTGSSASGTATGGTGNSGS